MEDYEIGDHPLADKFTLSLEHPRHHIGDVVSILWDGEIAWAKITGLADRAGELVYNVKIWTIGDMEYENRSEVGMDTWIFPDMIVRVN